MTTSSRFRSQELCRKPSSSMLNVLVKFLVVFTPTCAIALGGLWLALNHDGLLSVAGWMITVLLGLAAALEAWILVSGLVRIGRWASGAEQKLRELEGQDAELFAQGKSFDEIMSRHGKPKP